MGGVGGWPPSGVWSRSKLPLNASALTPVCWPATPPVQVRRSCPYAWGASLRVRVHVKLLAGEAAGAGDPPAPAAAAAAVEGAPAASSHQED